MSRSTKKEASAVISSTAAYTHAVILRRVHKPHKYTQDVADFSQQHLEIWLRPCCSCVSLAPEELALYARHMRASLIGSKA